jgi:hypothetical protein
MDNWTVEMVEERLAEAADVLKRLPKPRVQGYFNTWPRALVEFSDLVGQQPEPMRRPPSSPAAITRMEATMEWLRWLEPDDAKLVWMRAEGTRWKAVCVRFGISRATAHRRWEYALAVMAWRLNGRIVPQKRSRQHLSRLARQQSPQTSTGPSAERF